MDRETQERVVRILKKQADLTGNAASLARLNDAFDESIGSNSPLILWELLTTRIDEVMKDAPMFIEATPESARHQLKGMTWLEMLKIEAKDPAPLMRDIKVQVARANMGGASRDAVAKLAERKKVCNFETASFWLKINEPKDTCPFHSSASSVSFDGFNSVSPALRWKVCQRADHQSRAAALVT
jgi:hypothetical protein